MVRLPRARLAAACASIALLAVTAVLWPRPQPARLVVQTAAASEPVPAVAPASAAPTVDYAALAAALTPSTTSTTVPRRSSAAPPGHGIRTSTPPDTSAVVSGPHPCGGDLPPCRVMMRESGGNPTAVNPNGCVLHDGRRGCFGKWQFDWNAWPPGFDGYDRADHAPEAVQDARAREMWAGGRGCSRWAAC